MKKTLLDLAGQYQADNQARIDAENEKSRALTKLHLDAVKESFEKEFAAVLPMLAEAGIDYDVQAVDYRYLHQGVFVRFHCKGLVADMAYTLSCGSGGAGWRLESPAQEQITMVYGKWSMERFADWLVNKLRLDQ